MEILGVHLKFLSQMRDEFTSRCVVSRENGVTLDQFSNLIFTPCFFARKKVREIYFTNEF
jgi:hypothetical protein